jgi:hypothetical protein
MNKAVTALKAVYKTRQTKKKNRRYKSSRSSASRRCETLFVLLLFSLSFTFEESGDGVKKSEREI